MDKPVTSADANRRFSELLRGVRDGESYVVTAHGRPVARLSPVEGESRLRNAAREALFSRLDQQPAIDIGSWTRDELYER
jgi:prevent-host-death family protein